MIDFAEWAFIMIWLSILKKTIRLGRYLSWKSIRERELLSSFCGISSEEGKKSMIYGWNLKKDKLWKQY